MERKTLLYPGLTVNTSMVRLIGFLIPLDNCNAYCHLVVHPSMNHTEIFYEEHITKPIKQFLDKLGIFVDQTEPIEIPQELYNYR